MVFQGAIYEINVDPDLVNKDSMTVFINYRVFDYKNHFIGVTGVGLKVSAVKDLIKKYQQSYEKNILSTINLGVSQYHLPEKEDSFIARVDKLLYKAKQNGRNKTETELS